MPDGEERVEGAVRSGVGSAGVRRRLPGGYVEGGGQQRGRVDHLDAGATCEEAADVELTQASRSALARGLVDVISARAGGGR